MISRSDDMCTTCLGLTEAVVPGVLSLVAAMECTVLERTEPMHAHVFLQEAVKEYLDLAQAWRWSRETRLRTACHR